MAMKASTKQGFIARLLGDERAPDQGTPSHGVPMLAQWLPYRSFDRKTEIFHQTDSIAFALEVAPLVGADERTGEILAQFLSEGMPAASRPADPLVPEPARGSDDRALRAAAIRRRRGTQEDRRAPLALPCRGRVELALGRWAISRPPAPLRAVGLVQARQGHARRAYHGARFDHLTAPVD